MIYHNNTMQSGGLTVELNTKKDVRLEHNLSFEEFNRAFRKYRNIMCKAYPHRKAELEQYEADINEIGKSITINRNRNVDPRVNILQNVYLGVF
jgi:UDP-3-O-[3-hydroxymyristoyl] glucosamine N-acyltransferase